MSYLMVNITHITSRVPKHVKHPQMDFFTFHTGKFQHTVFDTVLIVAPRVDGTVQMFVTIADTNHRKSESVLAHRYRGAERDCSHYVKLCVKICLLWLSY